MKKLSLCVALILSVTVAAQPLTVFANGYNSITVQGVAAEQRDIP